MKAATIQFYHLTTSPMERALPKLLEKIVSSGFKVALAVESDERAEAIDQLLWSYDPGSFLPHGKIGGSNDESQPILIFSNIAPVSGEKRNLLFITDGRLAEGGFARVVDMFDGREESAVANARERWKNYKEKNHALTYFKQNEAGSWEKKDA